MFDLFLAFLLQQLMEPCAVLRIAFAICDGCSMG